MSAKDEIKQVVKDGIEQGQAEVGISEIPPVTKEQRKEAGRNIVAALFIKAWNGFLRLFG